MSEASTHVADVTVIGMTCEHCVAAVTEELEDVAGVAAVDVDLGSGRVRITSDRPVADGVVRAAVEEAGYRLG